MKKLLLFIVPLLLFFGVSFAYVPTTGWDIVQLVVKSNKAWAIITFDKAATSATSFY